MLTKASVSEPAPSPKLESTSDAYTIPPPPPPGQFTFLGTPAQLFDRRGPRSRASLPVPVPNLTKKSRGRRVPTIPNIDKEEVQPNGAQKPGRLYVCKVEDCGKCFNRGEHLKRHIRSIHTHEKRMFRLGLHRPRWLTGILQLSNVLIRLATSFLIGTIIYFNILEFIRIFLPLRIIRTSCPSSRAFIPRIGNSSPPGQRCTILLLHHTALTRRIVVLPIPSTWLFRHFARNYHHQQTLHPQNRTPHLRHITTKTATFRCHDHHGLPADAIWTTDKCNAD